MQSVPWKLAAAALCVGGLLAGCGGGDSPEQLRAQSDQHWPLLTKYCADCHNDVDLTANLSFESMSPDAIADNAEIWERAVRQLRSRMMPPPGGTRPTNGEVDGFVAWLEASLDQAATPYPGHVELHRLNRTEYANAIKELLGLDVDPGILPVEDQQDGFDNIAKALQVSPSFVEQYLEAARTLSATAVGNPFPRPVGVSLAAGNGREQQFHVEGLPLGTRGGAVFEHYFPSDGDYLLHIGNLIGGTHRPGQEHVNTVVALLDGKKFFELEIGGGEDSVKLDQLRAPAVEEVNKRLRGIPFTTTAGVHRLGVTFLHRSFAESDRVLPSLIPGDGQEAVMTLSGVEIFGPVTPKGLSMTPSRERIFVCYPNDASEYERVRHADRRQHGRQGISRRIERRRHGAVHAAVRARRRGRRLRRRDQVRAIRDSGSSEILVPLRARPGGFGAGLGLRAPNGVELAARLSFFLWSSVPDAELLELAAADALKDRDALEKQVTRMLADSRSATLGSNFAYQWLSLAKLDNLAPDPFVFGDVDGNIRADFVEEAWRFVDSIFREDRSVLDLLTADHSYLNERLARHYGINDVRGKRFRRVELTDEARWGLLGKGGVLLASSYPNRTSPVLRGAWVLEKIIGTHPPQPPPGVEGLVENVDGELATTVRERLEAHRTNPSCSGCHSVLDPLGYALENFDAVGRWREKDREAGTAIDSSGVLADGTPVDGPVALRQALTERPEQFVQTFTERLMTYALGRSLDYRDMPTVRAIVRQAAAENYRFSAIVWGIVTSDQFLMQGVPLPDLETDTVAARSVE